MIQSTQHRSYAKYENEKRRPILAYTEKGDNIALPLVPSGEGELILARKFGDYEIIVVDSDEDTRQILHG